MDTDNKAESFVGNFETGAVPQKGDTVSFICEGKITKGLLVRYHLTPNRYGEVMARIRTNDYTNHEKLVTAKSISKI